MAVNGINNGFPLPAASNDVKTGNSELGKDAFLKLLVAQMQNQDPMNPTQDKEFIAQMSTFSMVEQLQNMSNSMEASQAASLIGKQVTWKDTVNGTTGLYYDTVTAVRVKGTDVYVVVGFGDATKEIKLSDVQLIENVPEKKPETKPEGEAPVTP